MREARALREKPYIFIVDSSYAITFADSDAQALLGWSPAELLGKNIRECIPEEAVWDELPVQEPETGIQTKDGTMRATVCSLFPLTPAGTSILLRLTPETKKTAIDARNFVEANITGIVLSDAEFRIIDVNEAFSRMLGYTRDDFKNNQINWQDIISPASKDALDAILEKLKTQRIFGSIEMQFIRKDGRPVDVLIGSGMLDGDDEHCISS